MTQKITPKNSPEQGVDLSGKEGTEETLLPVPISLGTAPGAQHTQRTHSTEQH